MDGTCPNCRTPLSLPTSGSYRCERCGSTFEVALGSAIPPAPSPAYAAWTPGPSPAYVAPAVLADGAVCAAHPASAAAGTCERCGDFMCGLCTTWVEGRSYCPKCFDLMFRRGSFAFNQRTFTEPMWTLGVGIASVLISMIFPVAICAAIVGLVLGTRTLKTHQQRPDLPGRAATLWGTALCGAALVVSAGIGVWVVRLAMK